MTMFQLCSDDIVEELRLIQTLNRASQEGKTVIHFQNLFDISNKIIQHDLPRDRGDLQKNIN